MNTMLLGGALSAAETEFHSAGNELVRIGDMAKNFGVTLRALRFYEDKGLLTPLRDGSARLYTHKDRARLKLILLGRKVGFTLRDVKQMIDLYDPSGANTRQLRVAMEKGERQMKRLHNQRAAVEDAIGELGNLISAIRTRLDSHAAKAADPA